MSTARTTDKTVTEIVVVERGEATFHLIGDTPLVCNSMSFKAKGELLFPSGRKNAAERATSLKHNPIQEFRDSILRLDDGAPTLIALPAPAFKGAIRTAALDLPGATKSQIGRLTYVNGYRVPVYGRPEIFMTGVRSADISHTPDIRTRAILPRWACTIIVTFAEPLIRAQMVMRLLAAAGMVCGVGDGRPEKGALDFGTFHIVDAEDAEFLDIVATGARAAQLEAMMEAVPFDVETADLLTWFEREVDARKLRGVA